MPSEWSSLVNLEYLSVSLPDFFLSSGGQAGNIPAYFGNFTKLRTLKLRHAGWKGTIPTALGNLTNLEVLEMLENSLTGTIPASFNNLTKLTILDLSGNALTGLIPNILGIPATADVRINNNAFNFSGMETNISRLDQYVGQADIPMYVNGELSNYGSAPPNATLSVNAGGTLANNTYRWYRDNMLVATNVGNPNFLATNLGVYYVTVSNSQLPLLTLKSINFSITSLPVTLISFEGKHEDGQNKVVWKTTSETTNKGFEIERSADARNFEKIGFVDGSGDTKESQFYHFTDLNPLATSYYRLKQVDYDGKFEYSKVIMIKGSEAVFKIYPNPSKDELIVSGIEGEQDLYIVNDAGRIILQTKAISGKPVSLRSLKSGLYTVRVGNDQGKVLVDR
jgi:Leucine-rich repeat (LRR) protein